MAISDNDYKVLWGRAAGICSNPDCRTDLTVLLVGTTYNVGEMAHIIAESEQGPRGVAGGGSNTYENLILLCPTCHRRIDKAPKGEYTVELLKKWKSDHEAEIRKAGTKKIFGTSAELKTAVGRLLAENKSIWKEFGPKSTVALSDPGSNLHNVWTLRKLDTVVPNNLKIINSIESNFNLLSQEELEHFLTFKAHAKAFEANQYDRLDNYPLFPARFGEIFR